MSLTEAELSAIENRAHHLPDERLREDVLRLIAEVRQARAASAFAAVGDVRLKPEQEAEIERLIRNEIQARQQERRQRERHAKQGDGMR
jgi:hypothetical protein